MILWNLIIDALSLLIIMGRGTGTTIFDKEGNVLFGLLFKALDVINGDSEIQGDRLISSVEIELSDIY